MRIFFFFNDTATTEIYTLSLHDALPILFSATMPAEIVKIANNYMHKPVRVEVAPAGTAAETVSQELFIVPRSEEHTSELQSRQYLVCRLLLEKKKTKIQQSLKVYSFLIK